VPVRAEATETRHRTWKERVFGLRWRQTRQVRAEPGLLTRGRGDDWGGCLGVLWAPSSGMSGERCLRRSRALASPLEPGAAVMPGFWLDRLVQVKAWDGRRPLRCSIRVSA
jgi:hypothetical protein